MQSNYTDIDGFFKDGRVHRTFGLRARHRRIFDEYDMWEGYRGRPIIPRENNTVLRLAGMESTRWAAILSLCAGPLSKPSLLIYDSKLPVWQGLGALGVARG